MKGPFPNFVSNDKGVGFEIDSLQIVVWQCLSYLEASKASHVLSNRKPGFEVEVEVPGLKAANYGQFDWDRQYWMLASLFPLIGVLRC